MAGCLMESEVPFEAVPKEIDNESGQVISDCLAIPLILGEIFQHFTTTELLQLSFVNKRWSYEARSLMRTRGNVVASINKNQTCQDLRAFASDLGRMRETTKIVPFSGMTISVGGTTCSNQDHCQPFPNGDLEPVYEKIIESLTWKHFSLRHLVGWEQHKSCPGFMLGKKILRRMDSVLEELSVELQSDAAKYFRDEFLQDCRFSRLKTFRFLNEERSFESEWSDLIKIVVSNAPNLETLFTKGVVDLQANLLEGSSAVHLAGASYATAPNEIPECAAHQIKLHGMDLLSFDYVFNLERFNRITSMVLQSSNQILSSMYINVIFLAPLMSYGICLENVRRFRLALDLNHLQGVQPPILRIAKSFDFTRTFPNLDTVVIIHTRHFRTPDEFNEMIEQVNATLKTPTPDRAANIKHLKLHHLHETLRRCPTVSLLAQMFPNVQKLSIQDPGTTLGDIGNIWTYLKEVDFTLWCAAHTLRNHDSAFCGIFPQEVAQLREEDEEYLRRVNIVPVMPCLAYLKGESSQNIFEKQVLMEFFLGFTAELRNFKVSFEKMSRSYTGPVDDPTCLFSKVTALIAFQRCPNLTVTLKSEDERLAEALGHLSPYAPVVFETRTN